MSRIADALDAFSALLATLSGVTVEDNRDIPVDFIAETDHLNIIDDNDAAGPFDGHSTIAEHHVGVNVEGYVTRNTYAELRSARETLAERVWNLVAANPRLVVSGNEVTWDCIPGPMQRERQLEGKKPTAKFVLPVTLRVNTAANSLSVAA